jgi:hypothetical protein
MQDATIALVRAALLFVVACQSHSQPAPIRTETTVDPTTGDITARAISPSSGNELLAVRFEAHTNLLHWTDTIGTWTDPQPLDPVNSTAPTFQDVLTGAVVAAWFAGIDIPTSSRIRNDSCPSYLFHGDQKCSIPQLLVGPLMEICSACNFDELDSGPCTDHDACYAALPDSVCATADTHNSAKLACDDALGAAAAQICGSGCGLALKLATRSRGGHGWDPANTCDDHDDGTHLGLNYCGGYGERTCCPREICSGACTASGSATGAFPVDCACARCATVVQNEPTSACSNGIAVSVVGSTDHVDHVQVCARFGINNNMACGPSGGLAVGWTGTIPITAESGTGTTYNVFVPSNQPAAAFCAVVSGGSGIIGPSMPTAVVGCS